MYPTNTEIQADIIVDAAAPMTSANADNPIVSDSAGANPKIVSVSNPRRLRCSIGKWSYILAMLCLSYMMRKSKGIEHVKEIKDIATVTGDDIAEYIATVNNDKDVDTAKDSDTTKGADATKNIASLVDKQLLSTTQSIFTMLRRLKKVSQCEQAHKEIKDITAKIVLDKIMNVKKSIFLRACLDLILDVHKNKGYKVHAFRYVKNAIPSMPMEILIHDGTVDYFGGYTAYYDKQLRILYGECTDVTQMVWSLINDVVLYCFRGCEPYLCIASAGSKKTFSRFVDFSKLVFDDNGDPVYVCCCARTCTVPLMAHKHFKKLYLNDADPKIANFLSCMKDYPLLMIDAICNIDADDSFNKLREAKDLLGLRAKMTHDSTIANAKSVKCRVEAAASLFWWFQLSFCGNFGSGVSNKRLYPKNLDGKFPKMLSASLVLQKAVISCNDCCKFLIAHINNRYVIIDCDSPYVLIWGGADTTYVDEATATRFLKPFGIKEAEKLVSLIAASECKAFITHSFETEFENACYCAGLDYGFEYRSSFGTNSYVTIVYTKDITEKDFFVLRKGKSRIVDGKTVYQADINEQRRELFSKRKDKNADTEEVDA